MPAQGDWDPERLKAEARRIAGNDDKLYLSLILGFACMYALRNRGWQIPSPEELASVLAGMTAHLRVMLGADPEGKAELWNGAPRKHNRPILKLAYCLVMLMIPIVIAEICCQPAPAVLSKRPAPAAAARSPHAAPSAS